MISVINKPIANITGDENNQSKWVGAHQPIEFEIQRKDYNVLAIWNQTINNTACKVFQIQGNRVSDFAVGSTFNYVCSDDTLYSFTLTVFNVDFDGSRTYVSFERAGVFNISKISANQAFVNVNRLGYYIETLVYIFDKAGVGTLVGTLRTKTDTFGKSKVNVQKVISSYLSLENKFEYDKINKAQPTQGGQYQIRCREVYGVFEGKFTSMLGGDVLFYVNGSKQLQDPNNFNFGEFVPTQNDARENKAKFLSVFNRPTYFNGYPFSLSFIYLIIAFVMDAQYISNRKIMFQNIANYYFIIVALPFFVWVISAVLAGITSELIALLVFLTSAFWPTIMIATKFYKNYIQIQ